MALREFRLPEGALCTVVAVRPRYKHLVRESLSGGWLTMETARERRRYAPIRDGWETADLETLTRWWEEAEIAPKRDPLI